MKTRNTGRSGSLRWRPLSTFVVLGLALASQAQAQTAGQPGAMPDELRQAEALIGALVKQGMLPRARGEEMIREARQRAGLWPAAAARKGEAAAALPRLDPQVADNVSRLALRSQLKAEVRDELRVEVRREVKAQVLAEVRDEVLHTARELMTRSQAAALQQAPARAGAVPVAPPAVAMAPQAAAMGAVPPGAGTAAGERVAPPVGPSAASSAARSAARAGGPAAAASPAAAAAAGLATAAAVAPAAAVAATAAAAPVQMAAATAPAPAPAAAATPTAPPADNVVRVPYIPKTVRDAIRNEIKEEIVAQARAEQWGAPAAGAAAAAEWTDRLKIEGDIRVRHQGDNYGNGNLSPADFVVASLSGDPRSTRAADLAAASSNALPLANTEDDRNRLRLRARLAFTAKVTDSVSAGLRLATGSATDRVSTNQTLGQNANRYQFLLDRAFIKLEPTDGLSLTAGRQPNPWFATDLQWSENLNFEGLSGTWRLPAVGARTIEPFVTAGWFPIRENAPPRSGRSLTGAQAGLQWEGGRTRLRVGLAHYKYSQMEGRVDPDYDPTFGPGRSYGQYEYEAGLRQRGNTLFLTNNPAEVSAGLTPDRYRWGLASKFAPTALTVAAELSHFAPVVVMLSAEAVKNSAFDRAEIQRRTGLLMTDGSDTGLSLRATVGAQEVRDRNQWQAHLAYRRVGSDAVLDAFTDGDLGLGGTNLSGFSAGFIYGVDRNVTLGVRYLSAKQLDSMTVQPAVKSKYAIDSVQVDLNARF